MALCVGGIDADWHFADAFRLDWKAGRLVTTDLPSLPKPLANACGAVVGDVLYVAGGQAKPDFTYTLKAASRIDLSSKKPLWKEIDACPVSGQMLALAVNIVLGRPKRDKMEHVGGSPAEEPLPTLIEKLLGENKDCLSLAELIQKIREKVYVSLSKKPRPMVDQAIFRLKKDGRIAQNVENLTFVLKNEVE